MLTEGVVAVVAVALHLVILPGLTSQEPPLADEARLRGV